jgi:transcriptional regulator
MYVPAAFRMDDVSELARFVEEHAFAVLVSAQRGDCVATHVPFLIERDGDATILRAHMARANPQWRAWGASEVLVVFSGPHAYVSPRWYESRDSVPTWNYMTVHAYGTPRLVEDRERVLDLVTALSRRYEGDARDAWDVRELSPERLEAFLDAIVAFDIAVTRLEASYKLSQNRTAADRRGAIAALRREGSGSLADAMERF